MADIDEQVRAAEALRTNEERLRLALSAAELQTKYLNLLLPVDRGHYANLAALYGLVMAISIVVPLVALLVLRKRIRA